MQPDDQQVNLPDDLAVLGEELTASAAHLARVYPAPSFEAGRLLAAAEPVARPAARRTSRAWGFAAAGAACALAVAVVAWQIADGFRTEPANTQHVAAVPAEANTSTPAGSPPVEATPPEMPQSADVIPTVFHDLSAPELEGMLDLLEQQPAAATRLSI